MSGPHVPYRMESSELSVKIMPAQIAASLLELRAPSLEPTATPSFELAAAPSLELVGALF